MARPTRNTPKNRPAESVGVAGGLAGLVYAVADHNWAAAIIAGGSFLPAVVTLLIAHGGITTVCRQVWGPVGSKPSEDA